MGVGEKCMWRGGRRKGCEVVVVVVRRGSNVAYSQVVISSKRKENG